MKVMIDPTNVRGAFTGGVTPPQQSPQDQTVAPAAPTQQSTTASTGDALSTLESLVAESAQVATQASGQPPTQAVDPNPAGVQPQQAPVQQQPAQPNPAVAMPEQQPTEQVLQQQSVAANQPVVQAPLQDVDATAQAVIASMQTLPDSLNPPNPAPTSAKETFERPAAPDATSIDAGGAVQQVEVEKNPELPVEVEGFLQRVQDFSAQPPQEIVIADGTNEQASTSYPSRPVIVLPITEEEGKKGKKKSPRNSIRWLVEWSHKVIKMFAGKVIYRHVDQE